jgi:hypothetical protein
MLALTLCFSDCPPLTIGFSRRNFGETEKHLIFEVLLPVAVRG